MHIRRLERRGLDPQSRAVPLVSIILPTCDRPQLLERAVESVRGQTEGDFELIVVDNNRATEPVAERFARAGWRSDPRVVLTRPPQRRNAALARNAGLDLARGEWITYLDDDDAYRPGKIAAQLSRARDTGAPLVVCGAEFHLRGRTRLVQCEQTSWRGDDLILRARWNTPLLFHRAGGERFDASLDAGEDAEFAHRLLSRWRCVELPVVAEPLVDIHPQPGPRVNTNGQPVRRAAARILALRGGSFSREARRRFVLQTLLAAAKLNRRPAACARLSWRLLQESRGADWRACANALAMSVGVARGRWVS